jgi:stage V sporulation protein G
MVTITEVRIKLVNIETEDKLRAYCSIVLDDEFVIRDLKVVQREKDLFISMPNRKLTDRCAHCGRKNHLRARFCNNCGYKLDENRALRDEEGRAKLHADIAHPTNSEMRGYMQKTVIKAYWEELELSKQPGYKSRYDLDGEEELDVYEAA